MGKKKQTPKAKKAPETKIQIDADIDMPAVPLRSDSSASTVASTVAPPTAPRRVPRKDAPRRHPADRVAMVSLILSALLGFAFIVTLIVVDDDTLHGEYDDMFTPRSVRSYKAWGYAVLVLTAFAVVLSGVAMCAESLFTARWTLLFASALYIALLVSGNAVSSSETAARASYETEFAAKFNAFYCDVRTVRTCLSGDHPTLLLLTRGSNATTVQSSENATAVAVSVWDRCQQLLIWGIDATGDRVRTTTGDRTISDGVLAIDTKPLYAFLHDHGSSPLVDDWCGAATHRSSPMTDAEQRALPSPYASNPSVFKSYKREWSRRMVFANAMLGTALGGVVIAAVGYTIGAR